MCVSSEGVCGLEELGSHKNAAFLYEVSRARDSRRPLRSKARSPCHLAGRYNDLAQYILHYQNSEVSGL